MSKAIVPTADEINAAYKLSRESATAAIDHAVTCGRLLAKKKDSLKHGQFEEWVSAHCQFSAATARRYMQVSSKTLTRERFDSLRQALGYESKPKPKPETKPTAAVEDDGPFSDSAPAPKPAAAVPLVEPDPADPERPEDIDEDAAFALAEQDLAASTQKWLLADDKLAAAHEEIKRQAVEIALLKKSRDHYMTAAGEMTRQYKRALAKIARMEKATA